MSTLPKEIQGTLIAFVTQVSGDKRTVSRAIYGAEDRAGIQQLTTNTNNVKIEIYEITGLKLVGKHETTMVTEGILVPGKK